MLEHLGTIYAHACRWAFPLLVVMLIISLMTCNKEKGDRENLESRLNASAARTTQLENMTGKMVAQNQHVLTATSGEIKRLTDSVFQLQARDARLISQVTNYTRISQSGKFTGKGATYHDTITLDGKTVFVEQPADTNLIKVPRAFSFEDSTIKINGVVKRREVLIDSVKIENTLHFRTVTQKTGFLKLGRTTAIQALNSNPGIVSNQIAQVQVKPRVSFWNRVLKPLLFAAATGYVTKKFFK